MVVTGNTIRHTGERFQRSNETIANYFKVCVRFFSGGPFYRKYVVLPGDDAPIPDKILHNPKFKYFKGALGALDGSHIPCAPPKEVRPMYRNRK
ncbi:hypothetical protein FIBSPDRAFT_692577, partial [Athelia psychrophila]